MIIQSVWQKSFDFFAGKAIFVEPAETPLTGDAGLLPIRQFDERIGLTRRFIAALSDPRHPSYIDHTFAEMTRMRIYGILADSADQNDHDALRNDSAFGVPKMFDVCERLRLDYSFGARMNAFLKAESENRNKELKDGFQADRLSDHRYMANLFRLYMHAAACNLLVRLRRAAGDPPPESLAAELPVEALAGKKRHDYFNRRREQDPLGEGQPCTWRTRLIKVAAQILVTSRRVVVRLSGCWPYLAHRERGVGGEGQSFIVQLPSPSPSPKGRGDLQSTRCETASGLFRHQFQGFDGGVADGLVVVLCGFFQVGDGVLGSNPQFPQRLGGGFSRVGQGIG
jgi:hypothetical protein